MPSPEELYKAQVVNLPECQDPWFQETLARARTGDEGALRDISGRCLVIPLQIAEKYWRPDFGFTLLDLIEEGNRVLMKITKNFTVSSAAEFICKVKEEIDVRILRIVEHPALFLEEIEIQEKWFRDHGY